MAGTGLKLTWQKITGAVLISLVAVVLVLGYFFNEHWSPILEKKLHDAVLKSTDSLYNADFASAEFHLFQGKIVVFNVTLKPDTSVYNRKIKLGYAPNNLLDVHVKRIVINHVHPFKFYFEHKLDVEQIILSAPEVHLVYRLNHTRDTTSKDNRTAWQRIAKTLRSIHVHDIMLNDVQFKYDDHSGHKLAISELKEMNVEASDLLIDSLTQTDRSRFLFCRDVVMELNNYTGNTPSGLYSYTVKHLKLSTYTSQLSAEDVNLRPINADRFFKATANDSYALHIENLLLKGFDYLNYHKYRSFSVSGLTLDGGNFALYTNPLRPKTNADKAKSFPSSVLARLKIDTRIDTLQVKHLNISYTELNHKSNEEGTITFNNTEGTILNITNNAAALKKGHISTARLTSHFMNRGELNALFTFNLTDSLAAYSFKGNLGPMDLKAINPAAVPLGMVKINAGTLKKLDFDFKANSRIANGRVTVLYNNLKVTILKPDTQVQQGLLKKMRIASLYANIFVIKHDNPDEEGLLPRSAYVSYQRPVNSSFFNFTWKALFEGIKPGVGLDKKMQDATRALAEQSVIKKQNRKIKREMRKQRRAERRKKRAEKQQLKEAQNGTLLQ